MKVRSPVFMLVMLTVFSILISSCGPKETPENFLGVPWGGNYKDVVGKFKEKYSTIDEGDNHSAFILYSRPNSTGYFRTVYKESGPFLKVDLKYNNYENSEVFLYFKNDRFCKSAVFIDHENEDAIANIFDSLQQYFSQKNPDMKRYSKEELLEMIKYREKDKRFSWQLDLENSSNLSVECRLCYASEEFMGAIFYRLILSFTKSSK